MKTSRETRGLSTGMATASPGRTSERTNTCRGCAGICSLSRADRQSRAPGLHQETTADSRRGTRTVLLRSCPADQSPTSGCRYRTGGRRAEEPTQAGRAPSPRLPRKAPQSQTGRAKPLCPSTFAPRAIFWAVPCTGENWLSPRLTSPTLPPPSRSASD